MRSKLFFSAIILLVLTVYFISGCGPDDCLNASSTIETANEQLTRQLISIEGVAGIGIGEHNNRPCITVFLENDSPELRAKVPAEFQGFPVITEVTGPIVIQLESE